MDIYQEFIKSLWNLGCKNSTYPAHYFYNVITAGYTTDYRAYHNFTHIKNMLNVLYEIWLTEKPDDSIVKIDHLIISTFFHDLVYDPMTDICVDKSAELAVLFLQECLIPEKDIEIIEFLVRLTKIHELDTSDIVPIHHQEIFLNADNSILGSEPDKYNRYAKAVWSEYSTYYSPDQFRVGRKDFLFKKSTQPRIFFTKFMEDTYREIALINMFREVQELESWKHP